MSDLHPSNNKSNPISKVYKTISDESNRPILSANEVTTSPGDSSGYGSIAYQILLLEQRLEAYEQLHREEMAELRQQIERLRAAFLRETNPDLQDASLRETSPDLQAIIPPQKLPNVQE